MLFIVLTIWLVVVLCLSNLTKTLVTRIGRGFFFRVVIFPGVVVHELSHYAMCLLTGAKVHDLKLFEKRTENGQSVYGGYVAHGPSRLPFFGDPLISFAPLLGCMGMLVLMTWAFGDPLDLRNTLSRPSDPMTDIGGVLGSLLSVQMSVIWRFPKQVIQSALDWKFWVYLYLAFSLSVSLSPSWQDFQNSLKHLAKHFAVFLGLALVVFGVIYFAGLTMKEWNISDYIVGGLFGLMAFTIATQVITCLLAAIGVGIRKLVT